MLSTKVTAKDVVSIAQNVDHENWRLECERKVKKSLKGWEIIMDFGGRKLF